MNSAVGERDRFAAFIKGIIHSRSSTSPCSEGTPPSPPQASVFNCTDPSGRGSASVRRPQPGGCRNPWELRRTAPSTTSTRKASSSAFPRQIHKFKELPPPSGPEYRPAPPPSPSPQPLRGRAAAFAQPGPLSPAGTRALRHPRGPGKPTSPECLTSRLKRCFPPASPGALSRSSGEHPGRDRPNQELTPRGPLPPLATQVETSVTCQARP